KWFASFHYVDWKGVNKRKKKTGFATRKEAQEYERRFLEAEKDDPDIMFSALVENYYLDIESRMKPTTLVNKHAIIDSLLLPQFKDMKISAITPAVIRKWQNLLLDYTDSDGKEYSKTYLKAIHTQMSTIMHYAVRYYGLKQNPCTLAGVIGESNADEMKIWTREEFERFITFEKSESYRVAFEILFYTGMREGELLALTKTDIPEDRKEIDINKTFATVNGEDLFLEPKTPWSKRVVQIHSRLHDEIMTLLSHMYLYEGERIFYFKKAVLLNEFKRVARAAGLEPIRIHDLRHSHASMLIDMGVPITEISKRLGHKNPSVTLRVYSHMYGSKERNIAQKIDGLFDPDDASGDEAEST
ncbi:MAG: site-specific integrase, partial [Lachnospiraceae bacterium]|nr:site-specific integrase [Lachnospiraceae bacterium]